MPEKRIFYGPVQFNSQVTFAGGTSQSSMIAAGAATTLTALQSGKRVALDTAAGSTVTLPAATGSGASFSFIVTVTATGSHIIQVANSSDTISGFIYNNDLDSTAPAFYKGNGATSTDDTITMNHTTTGGIIGDTLELVDIKANLWLVRNASITCVAGSNIATPFSAAV